MQVMGPEGPGLVVKKCHRSSSVSKGCAEVSKNVFAIPKRKSCTSMVLVRFRLILLHIRFHHIGNSV